MFLNITLAHRIVVAEAQHAVSISADNHQPTRSEFAVQRRESRRFLHAGRATGEPDLKEQRLATEVRDVKIAASDARQGQIRGRCAFPAANLARDA